MPRNIVAGVRVNAALAYVTHNRERDNLTIEIQVTVRRVVTTGSRAIGVEIGTAIIDSTAMRRLGVRRTSPTPRAELDTWISDNITTAVHLCSSAPMGPDTDPMAVVDQYCRVRGVEGLRVVDTSVLPTAPSRGPAATAVLIGERAAAFFDGGLP